MFEINWETLLIVLLLVEACRVYFFRQKIREMQLELGGLGEEVKFLECRVDAMDGEIEMRINRKFGKFPIELREDWCDKFEEESI